ncbi:hypothetical protein BJV38_003880 [Clostridium beijerinckii]|nr:hypothetical protein [Clostridium beijerinckii]NRZ18958.1 hypothetical protein [Clostridium beijerinckii]
MNVLFKGKKSFGYTAYFKREDEQLYFMISKLRIILSGFDSSV